MNFVPTVIYFSRLLKQWFSTRGHLGLLGTFNKVWRHIYYGGVLLETNEPGARDAGNHPTRTSPEHKKTQPNMPKAPS